MELCGVCSLSAQLATCNDSKPTSFNSFSLSQLYSLAFPTKQSSVICFFQLLHTLSWFVHEIDLFIFIIEKAYLCKPKLNYLCCHTSTQSSKHVGSVGGVCICSR